MQMIALIILITLLICFFIGANDSPVIVQPSIQNNDKTDKLNSNFWLMIIGEILGAIFLGSIVANTIINRIVDLTPLYNNIDLLFISIISILIVVFVFLLASQFIPFPISTSHTMIGGIIGIGYLFKFKLFYPAILKIALIWILTPILGLVAGFLFYQSIKFFIFKKKNPQSFPFLFLFFLIVIFFFCLKIINKLDFSSRIVITLTLFSIIILMVYLFIKNGKRIKNSSDRFKQLYYQDSKQVSIEGIIEEYEGIENLFKPMQKILLPFISFAHGANDTGNAISLASLFIYIYILNRGKIFNLNLKDYQIQTLETCIAILLLAGSIALSSGIMLLGRKRFSKIKIENLKISPIRGFCIYLASSLVIILTSGFGYRVSTVYTLAGSLLGIGYSKGFEIFNSKLLIQLTISWLFTFLFSIVSTYFLCKMFMMLFNLNIN